MKKNFGISLEQYDALLQKQDYKCAICKTETPGGRGRFHVDHNHDTGKIRGILCSNCNLGLGKFQDSPKLLQKAMEYLDACPH